MPGFDEAWPCLQRRVRSALAARGVRGHELDDLTQETALRLFRAWPTLDADRDAGPYAVTIALNAWKDGLKRAGAGRELLSCDPPELADPADVERTVLGRLEVSRVSRALGALRPRDRAALMAEQAGAAGRMARMRARRELLLAMERASGVAIAVGLLRRLWRPKAGAVALSASALTLVSLAPFAQPPVHVAPLTEPPVVLAQPHHHASLVAVHRVTGRTPAAPLAPRFSPDRARAAAPRAAARPSPCEQASSDDQEQPDSGLPVAVTVLGPDVVADLTVRPTGTRVRSDNRGCTQVYPTR